MDYRETSRQIRGTLKEIEKDRIYSSHTGPIHKVRNIQIKSSQFILFQPFFGLFVENKPM